MKIEETTQNLISAQLLVIQMIHHPKKMTKQIFCVVYTCSTVHVWDFIIKHLIHTLPLASNSIEMYAGVVC